MIIESMDYISAGRNFGGTLALPDGGASSRPSILVFHEGTGLGEHPKERARRLAELGYVAYAPDLFGEVFADRAQGLAVIRDLVERPKALRVRATAALAALSRHARVDPARCAAIGYCLGGFATLELARRGVELCCAVSFHGGLGTSAPASAPLACKVLVCTGADDPFAPREQRTTFEEEMKAVNADWQMIVYANTLHAFTNPRIDPAKFPGCAYSRSSDERSWRAMRALFDEAMGVP